MKKPLHVFGLHAVASLLDRDPVNVIKLHSVAGQRNLRLQAMLDTASRLGINSVTADAGTIDKLADGNVHQGVVAEYLYPGAASADLLIDDLATKPQPWLILALDEVQDPHNLGACLRSASAMAVDAIVVPKDNSAGITPVVQKVSAGAAVSVPLYRATNLYRSLSHLKDSGAWVFGAAGDAEKDLQAIDFHTSSVIVMGKESSGLRQRTREACDELFRIPMQGDMQSLNVSVAAGIALYEARRHLSG